MPGEYLYSAAKIIFYALRFAARWMLDSHFQLHPQRHSCMPFTTIVD